MRNESVGIFWHPKRHQKHPSIGAVCFFCLRWFILEFPRQWFDQHEPKQSNISKRKKTHTGMRDGGKFRFVCGGMPFHRPPFFWTEQRQHPVQEFRKSVVFYTLSSVQNLFPLSSIAIRVCTSSCLQSPYGMNTPLAHVSYTYTYQKFAQYNKVEQFTNKWIFHKYRNSWSVCSEM